MGAKKNLSRSLDLGLFGPGSKILSSFPILHPRFSAEGPIDKIIVFQHAGQGAKVEGGDMAGIVFWGQRQKLSNPGQVYSGILVPWAIRQ